LEYLLDTNVALYLLKGRQSSPLPVGRYFVSIITEIELLSYSGLTVEEEASIYRFLGQVSIVGITTEIKQATIELRKNNRLKLPDSIISATSQYIDSILLTNDTTLVKLKDIKSQTVPLI
jgi:predicted nucleic acid-binding protein